MLDVVGLLGLLWGKREEEGEGEEAEGGVPLSVKKSIYKAEVRYALDNSCGSSCVYTMMMCCMYHNVHVCMIMYMYVCVCVSIYVYLSRCRGQWRV